VGDDLPVGGLKWLDTCEFVRKVGNGARLPKEAEWEYACRAGTATAFPWGDSCNGNEANCDGEWPYGTKKKGPKLGEPAKGGSYPPNAWGFCDMNGNMSEWCSDSFKIWPKEEKELVDPEGMSGGTSKALRGGSFYDAAKFCRSASRKGFVPDSGQPHLGFRLAMSE
jgi:formylglycine-generating enzyme required for sulfatase activity